MEKLIELEKKIGEKGFLIVLFFLCLVIYYPTIENDTYWIVNTGKYIVNNGFPFIDPFTIHQGLNITVQQWLSDVIFYGVDSSFGQSGIFAIMLLGFFINCIVLYRICINISNNRVLSKVIVLVACIFISLLIKARPQIFSQLIFLIEILMLEKYILYGKKRYLLCLILLSVLLINLHAAMWPVFFLLFAPYILDGIKHKKFTQGYGVLPLLTTFVASLLVGILNPYGMQNMLYFTKAYGIDVINNNIQEMFSPDFKSALGICVFILMLICVTVIKGKGKTTLRHSLLVIGTLYMGLSSARSLFLFFICAPLFIASYLKENHKLDDVFVDARKRMINYLAILLIIISAMVIRPFNHSQVVVEFEPKGAVDYIKQNVDTSSMRLFNDFESGGYLEYNGLKTFIDSRCELFVKQVNKKEDIFTDYVNYTKGKLYYKDLVKKYNLTHLLVKKEDPITIYLINDKDYKTIYSDNKFVLIEVNGG